MKKKCPAKKLFAFSIHMCYMLKTKTGNFSKVAGFYDSCQQYLATRFSRYLIQLQSYGPLDVAVYCVN